MLAKGPENWLQPITAKQAAPFFHRYITGKAHRLRTEFSDKQGKELREYNERKMTSLIHRMPMSKWSSSSKGLISYTDRLFTIHLNPLDEHHAILYEWTKEICDYRLHTYFERKALNL